MNTSTSIASLVPAFIACQGELQHVAKDKDNPFFKSKYADLTSCIDAVRSVAQKHGLGFIQGIERGTTEGYVAVTTRVIHTSGEWIESSMELPMTKKDAQGSGQCGTYGRRYGLSAMFGLGQEDDDGNSVSLKQPKVDKKPASNADAGSVVTNGPASAASKKKKGKADHLSPEAFTDLEAKFKAATTKEDITKLVGEFTALHPEDQTKMLPVATEARKRAGL